MSSSEMNMEEEFMDYLSFNFEDSLYLEEKSEELVHMVGMLIAEVEPSQIIIKEVMIRVSRKMGNVKVSKAKLNVYSIQLSHIRNRQWKAPISRDGENRYNSNLKALTVSKLSMSLFPKRASHPSFTGGGDSLWRHQEENDKHHCVDVGDRDTRPLVSTTERTSGRISGTCSTAPPAITENMVTKTDILMLQGDLNVDELLSSTSRKVSLLD
ncbi:hypothetical protein ACFX2B_009752 [Malus domestica]